MSGHSRWSQIKHKKAVADAKKGRVFGKIARAIAVAARENPDPATNPRLKAEIDRAREVHMPSDNINRVISRVGDASAEAFSEIQLEFIAPGGTAVIVDAITDNSNRTIHELKHLASLHDARPAGRGALLWLFRTLGVLRTAPPLSEELQLAAIDAGAEDVVPGKEEMVLIVPPEKLAAVRSVLGERATSSDIIRSATSPVVIEDPNIREKLRQFLADLEEHDDVQRVSTNAELT